MNNTAVRILLVEDNNIARQIEAKIISQFHCQVDGARDGAEALKLLNNNHYDLVFMDINLPDTDGLRLTETIRAMGNGNKKVPIVALTTYDDNTHHNQATWVGVNSYITKPLTVEKCERALKKFIQIC
jgi:CheY-like chemotaxis protein